MADKGRKRPPWFNDVMRHRDTAGVVVHGGKGVSSIVPPAPPLSPMIRIKRKEMCFAKGVSNVPLRDVGFLIG